MTMVMRDGAIKILGEEEAVERAVKAVQAMIALYESGLPLDEQAVRYCIALAREGDEEKISDLLLCRTPFIYQLYFGISLPFIFADV